MNYNIVSRLLCRQQMSGHPKLTAINQLSRKFCSINLFDPSGNDDNHDPLVEENDSVDRQTIKQRLESDLGFSHTAAHKLASGEQKLRKIKLGTLNDNIAFLIENNIPKESVYECPWLLSMSPSKQLLLLLVYNHIFDSFL